MVGRTNASANGLDVSKMEFIQASRYNSATVTVPANTSWRESISSVNNLQVGKPYMFIGQFNGTSDTRIFTNPQIRFNNSVTPNADAFATVSKVGVHSSGGMIRLFAIVIPKVTYFSSIDFVMTNTVSQLSVSFVLTI